MSVAYFRVPSGWRRKTTRILTGRVERCDALGVAVLECPYQTGLHGVDPVRDHGGSSRRDQGRDGPTPGQAPVQPVRVRTSSAMSSAR